MSSQPAPESGRLPLPARMLTSQVVAVLPDEPVASMMAPVEVMLQEGIQVFSLPAGDVERLTTLHTIFGARGSFGVHGVIDPDGIDALIATGIEFALPVGPALVELAPGVPCLPRGGVGSYALRKWISSGAPAACLDEILVGDACTDSALPALRERCRSVLAVIADERA
ncbi:MAG: aldolase [Acidipropionibacterium acidipropionici]|nr:aldolase [Acidipropionibacterium acidipropionici]